MALATYQVLVDWNNDGDFADTNEDITADVISLECSRGRDYASQLTGRASAGRLSAVLLNTTGKYSSFNASSPLYGSILPGRPVTLKTTSPVAVSLWYGYLDNILPDVPVNGVPTVRLEASGGLIKLGQGSAKVNAQADAGNYTGTIADSVLTAAGWPVLMRLFNASQGVTGPWYAKDRNPLEAIRELEDTELGFFYERENGDLVWEGRYHRLTGARLVAQATFTDAPGGTLGYQTIQQDDALQGIYNSVSVDVQIYTLGTSATLWTLTGETPVLAPGQSRTWTATWPNAGDATNGVYVQSWGDPVVGTDLTQTGVANSDIGIATAKTSNTMTITVTNNHATKRATITLLRAVGTPVTVGSPVRVTAADATSQARYGVRTYSPGTLWHPSASVATDYAGAILARYSNPQPTLSLTFPASKDATHMAEALTRAISDRLTIVAANNTRLGISGDFFVERIAHTLSAGGNLHLTTYTLSYADPAQAYWVLGTSALGMGSVLGW